MSLQRFLLQRDGRRPAVNCAPPGETATSLRERCWGSAVRSRNTQTGRRCMHTRALFTDKPGTFTRDLPQTLHTHTHFPGVGVRLLTPLVWGSPLTAAHLDWSHILPSPGGSGGASEGEFYYTGHLWQPWFPLGEPRLPPATRPPASPWAAAGGSVSEERFRGRLHTDGARSGAERDGAPPTGGSDEWGAEADWPSTTKHNTARNHMTIKALRST